MPAIFAQYQARLQAISDRPFLAENDERAALVRWPVLILFLKAVENSLKNTVNSIRVKSMNAACYSPSTPTAAVLLVSHVCPNPNSGGQKCWEASTWQYAMLLSYSMSSTMMCNLNRGPVLQQISRLISYIARSLVLVSIFLPNSIGVQSAKLEHWTSTPFRSSSPSFGSDTLFHFFFCMDAQQVEEQGIGIQVHFVPGRGHNISNFTSRIDAPKFHETWILLDGISNEFGRFGFSAGLGNNGLLLLHGTNHNVLGAFGVLLGCFIFVCCCGQERSRIDGTREQKRYEKWVMSMTEFGTPCTRLRWTQRVYVPTCFASTALAYSLLKERWVMAISSNKILNPAARSLNSRAISAETISRLVRSSFAL